MLQFDMNICLCCLPKKEKTSYHHGNLKEALLEVAFEIIDTQGIDALTVRELGKQLNISRSAIYRHFASKNDLITNVLRAGFDKLDEACEEALVKEGLSIIDRLIITGKVYLHFAIKHPALYRLMYGKELQTTRLETCNIMDEVEAKGFHSLVSLLSQGQDEGLFIKEDPLILAFMITALSHGQAMLYIDGHAHIIENIEAILELSVKTLLLGITPRDSTSNT